MGLGKLFRLIIENKLNNITRKLALVGLNESDIEGEITSIDEIVNIVSSSHRLFRKSLEYIILRDIRLFFQNEKIELADKLEIYFPRKGRRAKWVEFSYYFDLTVPALKLTTFSIFLIILVVLATIAAILWIIFGETELYVHSVLSNVPLIPVIVMSVLVSLGLIATWGHDALPARTIEELVDKIISRNLSDLLTEDKILFKELVLRELETVSQPGEA